MSRRPHLPPALTGDVERGDRVLAGAELADGSWALATQRELRVADDDGPRHRYPWAEILHAAWDGDTRALTVTFVDDASSSVTHVTKDDDVEAFASAVRERVTSSLVHSLVRPLPTGGEVQVLIRRAADGSLFSQTALRGRRPTTTADADAILAAEAWARQAVGLTR